MLKRIIVLWALALALVSSAGADESGALRIDASSNRAFERSLAAFKDELSPERRQALGDALVDIWLAGTQAAEGEGRKYRTEDYYRQIDGLGYIEVVSQATGESANLRNRQPSVAATEQAPPRADGSGLRYERPSPWANVPPRPPSFLEQPRGGTPLTGPSLR